MKTILLALIFSVSTLISSLWKVKLYRYPWFLLFLVFYPFIFLALVFTGRLWALKYPGCAYRRQVEKSVKGGYTIKNIYNQHARRIGRILNLLGGFELMSNAAHAIYWLDHEAFYQLEWCWEGVGGWMP